MTETRSSEKTNSEGIGPMMMKPANVDIQTDPQTNFMYIIVDGQMDAMPL